MPRYDEEDNLVFPWNKTVLKPFLTRAKCFVDQYSSFEEFDMKVRQ